MVDVDNDKDILDIICSLKVGDEVEVFVRHLVDEAIVEPMLIENGSHVDIGESGATFNIRPCKSENFNFGVGEKHLIVRIMLLLFQPHIHLLPNLLSLPHLVSILLLQMVLLMMK